VDIEAQTMKAAIRKKVACWEKLLYDELIPILLLLHLLLEDARFISFGLGRTP
jgi:hypothetical protein